MGLIRGEELEFIEVYTTIDMKFFGVFLFVLLSIVLVSAQDSGYIKKLLNLSFV